MRLNTDDKDEDNQWLDLKGNKLNDLRPDAGNYTEKAGAKLLKIRKNCASASFTTML